MAKNRLTNKDAERIITFGLKGRLERKNVNDALMRKGAYTMRRVMSVILTAALAVVLGAVPALADGPAVEVSSGEAAPGETVVLDFTLTGNPGIAAYSADLAYSKNALELVSLASGREISGFTFISYVPTMRVAAFSVENTSGDGVLFRATFRVLDDAAEGFAPVSLSFSEMADVSYTSYSPAIVSGGVTVLPAAESGGEPADDVEIVDSVVVEPDESMDFGGAMDEIAAGMVGEEGAPIIVTENSGSGGTAGTNTTTTNTNTDTTTSTNTNTNTDANTSTTGTDTGAGAAGTNDTAGAPDGAGAGTDAADGGSGTAGTAGAAGGSAAGAAGGSNGGGGNAAGADSAGTEPRDGAGGTEPAEAGAATAPETGEAAAAGTEPGKAEASAGESAAQSPDREESGSRGWIAAAVAAVVVIAAAVVIYIFIIRKKKSKSAPEKETEKTGVD